MYIHCTGFILLGLLLACYQITLFQTHQLNVERVQRCVSNVIFTVREVKNDLTRETSFTASVSGVHVYMYCTCTHGCTCTCIPEKCVLCEADGF